MDRRHMAVSLALVMACTAAAPMTAEASSSYSMKKR